MGRGVVTLQTILGKFCDLVGLVHKFVGKVNAIIILFHIVNMLLPFLGLLGK
jgi:hypothetical protein